MKKILLTFVLLCSLALTPALTCKPSPTYTTLATVEASTLAAYSSYCQLVVAGQIPTNSVPMVSRDFNLFQATMSATVAVAAQGTNSPTTQPVSDAAAKVISDINQAKLNPAPIPGK